MITNETELEQTHQELLGMYRSLRAVRRNHPEATPKWRAILEGGFLDSARQMQQEIEEYLGAKEIDEQLNSKEFADSESPGVVHPEPKNWRVWPQAQTIFAMAASALLLAAGSAMLGAWWASSSASRQIDAALADLRAEFGSAKNDAKEDIQKLAVNLKDENKERDRKFDARLLDISGQVTAVSNDVGKLRKQYAEDLAALRKAEGLLSQAVNTLNTDLGTVRKEIANLKEVAGPFSGKHEGRLVLPLRDPTSKLRLFNPDTKEVFDFTQAPRLQWMLGEKEVDVEWAMKNKGDNYDATLTLRLGRVVRVDLRPIKKN